MRTSLDVRWHGAKVLELRQPILITELMETIPVGFKSDGATIPKWLHWFARPYGDALYAALVHDYLLQHGDYPRYMCDKLFHTYLLRTGVNRHKATIMYCAVRLYSWLVDH